MKSVLPAAPVEGAGLWNVRHVGGQTIMKTGACPLELTGSEKDTTVHSLNMREKASAMEGVCSGSFFKSAIAIPVQIHRLR